MAMVWYAVGKLSSVIRCVVFDFMRRLLLLATARVFVLDSLFESGFVTERCIAIDFESSASEWEIVFLLIGGVFFMVL